MTNKQMTRYLVLGLIAGLFLTACAGVVSGQIDLPVLFGPRVDMRPDSSEQVVPVAPAAIMPVEEGATLETGMAAHLQSHGVIKAQLQSQIQYENVVGHFCTQH